MLRKLPLLSVLLLTVLFTAPKIFAVSDKFSTSIISTYTVHTDGVTTVDQRVTLTNKTSQFFAKEYTFSLATENVNNINGRDAQGNIVKHIQRKRGQTRIFLAFNKVIVGKDKEFRFRISYSTNEVVTKQGHIWKVFIPALPESESLESYSAVLKVPNSFPKMHFFKPEPQEAADFKFVWDRDSLKSLGAIGYFGSSQFYQAKLNYGLANKSLKSEMQNIALPPDTPYQKIILQHIAPKPENIVVDKDGNWLAIYNIPPKTEIDIAAALIIETFIAPREGFKNYLTESERLEYLRPQKFWETGDAKIKKLADDLSTPKAIYRYVVNNLSYNFKKLEGGKGRIGAAASLQNKNNAVCTEFTDLFIALSRAAGIPAREINGYAYTEDEALKPLSLVSDILHAWPAYYDERLKIWRQVDPTWGNTTGGIDYFTFLDFDHVVFANHGISSTYPSPAGSYKQKSTGKNKQVEISFVKDIPEETNKPINLELDFPKEIDTSQDIEGVVRLTNPNNVAKYNIQPKIISKPLKLLTKIERIPVLPPLSTYEIKVKIAPSNQLAWVDNEIQGIYNSIVTRTTVKVVPWVVSYIPFILGGAFAVIVLGIALYMIKKKI